MIFRRSVTISVAAVCILYVLVNVAFVQRSLLFVQVVRCSLLTPN